MSYSCGEPGCRNGTWVVRAKYASPSSSGFCPTADSWLASLVAPTYLRSATRWPSLLQQPWVSVAVHFGSTPLLACSSKPVTRDWMVAAPEPCCTCAPESGSSALDTAPPGRLNDAGWVMTDAGRGAA